MSIENKYEHLRFPMILMGISLFLTLCIAYLDEGKDNRKFLSDPKEIGPLLVYTVLFSLLPVVFTIIF